MINKRILVTRLVENKGQSTLTASLTVKVSGHKDTSTASFCGALTTQTVDLAVIIDLVVLEDGKLDLPVLVLDLLGGGVILLLALLATTSQSEDQVKGRFLLDIVIRQGASIFQLLASEDQSLLVRGNSLLILNLGLHILDGIAGLNLKGDCFARQGLDENLHDENTTPMSSLSR